MTSYNHSRRFYPEEQVEVRLKAETIISETKKTKPTIKSETETKKNRVNNHPLPEPGDKKFFIL